MDPRTDTGSYPGAKDAVFLAIDVQPVSMMTDVFYRRRMSVRPDVLIIGAGVSGLSTAIRLAEIGLAVEIRARDLPLHTTSCAAAAMWAPYLVTDARLQRWSLVTYQELVTLGVAHGVRSVRGREVAREQHTAPAWMRALPQHRDCTPQELPPGFLAGWWYETPVVDMPVYLAALVGRLERLGVRLVQASVDSVAEAQRRAPIVVNCAGSEAHVLTADRDLTPVRGQLVVVENPGIDEFFAEHEELPEPTYFVPHGDRLVLGGSVEPHQTHRLADHQTAVAIHRRCAAIEPAIRNARIIEHRVGIRPHRTRVRLGRETTRHGHVVHNYGHGGAGVTLSWGCAQEVRELVREVV